MDLKNKKKQKKQNKKTHSDEITKLECFNLLQITEQEITSELEIMVLKWKNTKHKRIRTNTLLNAFHSKSLTTGFKP